MHLKGTHLLKYLSCVQTFRELHHSDWGQVHPMLSNRTLPAGNLASVCSAVLARKFSSSVSLTTKLSYVTARCPPCMARSIATPSSALLTALFHLMRVSVSRIQGAGARQITTYWNHVWRKRALL